MIKKNTKRISALFLAVSVWILGAMPVSAAGDAQAHIGRIRPCAVLSEPDMTAAAENIKDSAVSIKSLFIPGTYEATGSGVVVGVALCVHEKLRLLCLFRRSCRHRGRYVSCRS